jgi:hypothetical protein
MDTGAPTFTAWLVSFFAAYYRRRPVNATFIGRHDYDHVLPDCSTEGLDAQLSETRTLIRSLRDLPIESLTEAEAMDRRLAEGFLEIAGWEVNSAHFERGNPSFYTGEAIFGVFSLLLRPFAPFSQRLQSVIARLQAIPTLLEQGRAVVRTAPTAWTQRAIRECVGALAFLDSGVDQLILQHAIVESRFRSAADTAAGAFSRHREYLETDLLAHPSTVWATGEEAFALLLRHGHCLSQTAKDIERDALATLEQCTAYLAEHAAAFDARTSAEALAGLAEFHPSVDDYYSRFGDRWKAARDAVVAAGLVTWPDYPVRYVPQPAWARAAAPNLYFLPYRAPAPFDRVDAVEYLIPPIDADLPLDEQQVRLRATNDSVITLNHVVHHGGLGHQLQNYHAYRAVSRIGQVAAVDCASRIAMSCGGTMAEGWACYATELMAEIGFLSPLEVYSEQQARLRMAARAIVDVRLHRGDLSLDDAAAFYRDRVGMPVAAAQAEAVKNSMFPGAAVIYLVGTDMIRTLRHDLGVRAGGGFNLCDFHDNFLSYGSVPIALIASAMRQEDNHAQ